MSIYSGKPVTIARPIGDIYPRVSDIAQYREIVESLPESQRQRLQGIVFENDTVKMDAPGVGALVFKVTERIPSTHVGLEAIGSPIPLKLSLDLAEANDGAATTLTPRIDIQIPAMLKPFIGNKIQEAADKFGEVFTSLFPNS